jgi:hypothetical protein
MFLCEALDSLAKALLASGEKNEAASVLERMETTARDIGATNFLPFVAWRRAELAALREDPSEQERLLREAHTGFIERDAEGHAATLALQLEALSNAR